MIRACSAGNSSSHSGSSSHSASRTSASVRSGALGPCRHPRAHEDLRLAQQRPHLVRHGRLDLGGRHPGHDVVVGSLPLQQPLGHVVAVEPPTTPRVGGRQRPTVHPEDQALQQGRRLRPVPVAPHPRAFLEHRVNLVPQLAADDRLVLTGVDLPLVRDLAHVGPVVQQLVDVALVEQPAGLAGQSLLLELLGQRRPGAGLDEALEHAPDDRSLGAFTTSLRSRTS